MTQYYIFEIKQLKNGDFEHNVYYAWDEDREKAFMKAQQKYHELLSTAAVSDTLKHSAIIIDSSAAMVENRSFVHVIEEPEADTEHAAEPTEEI